MSETAPRNDDRFLTAPVSVYLDIVRFLAALAVVIGHAVQDGLSEQTYPLASLSHEAVIIFFVLSGLVISSTSMRPGLTLRDYFVARAARIYPVVIPAILLSFCAFALAGFLGINESGWESDRHFTAMTAMTSFLFLNESWFSTYNLPWNNPFWSICYEVFYYIMFACLLFGRGIWRWIAFLVAAAFAGPRILALAPIWAMGVWIVKDQRLRVSSPTIGLALVISTWILILWFDASGLDELVQNWLFAHVPGWWRMISSQKMLTDHLLGLLVMANFIGFRACGHWFTGMMQALKRPVQFLAGSTFSLYLFHRPMTKFLAASGVSTGHDMLAFTGLLMLIVIACFLLATGTEKQRDKARVLINALLDLGRQRRMRSTGH